MQVKIEPSLQAHFSPVKDSYFPPKVLKDLDTLNERAHALLSLHRDLFAKRETETTEMPEPMQQQPAKRKRGRPPVKICSPVELDKREHIRELILHDGTCFNRQTFKVPKLEDLLRGIIANERRFTLREFEK